MRRRAPRASVATPPPEAKLPLASPARQLLLSAGVLLCFGVSSLTQEALTTLIITERIARKEAAAQAAQAAVEGAL